MVNRRRDISRSSTTSDSNPDLSDHPLDIPDMSARQDQNVLLGIIASLYLNPDYSDIEIICENKCFPAHKLVLCPRSKYFQRACCGEFKESKGIINLDTKSSILIEKMLEFLYTGNYILEDNTTKVNDPQSDSDKELGSKNVIDSQTDEKAMEDIPDEMYDINRTALLSSGGTTAESMHEPPKNETRPLNGEAFTTDFIDLESIVNPLTDCHPCYFHLRMYAEADYFMIEDLKTRAEENFCASFIDCAETKFLARLIRELFSTRANYLDLRVLAMKLLVDNLRALQEKSTPAINSSLLEENPDFAIDLCMATMKKYLSGSSGTNQPVFTAKYKYEYKPFQYGQWKT